MYEEVIARDEAEVLRLQGVKDALTAKIHDEDEKIHEVGEMKVQMQD